MKISSKFCSLLGLALLFPFALFSQIPAFPGAEGFGATASGGRGGQVVFVTNTNYSGPGSFQAALDTPGPKYILFRVSGVIDGTVDLPIGSADVTIAGQTSPYGIVTRGFRSFNDQGHSTDNLIMRHIRSRSGIAATHPTQNDVVGDGLSFGGVHKAIIDHCSFAQNYDEAIDFSRSSEITVQNCILAETMGDHWYLGGMLTNYNEPGNRLDSFSIHHNTWARIGGRMPEFSCESGANCENHTMHAEISNNLYYDQTNEVSHNAATSQGGSSLTYHLALNIENNYSFSDPSFCHGLFQLDLLNHAANQLYVNGNNCNVYPNYSDYELFGCCDDFCTTAPNTDPGSATHLSSRHPYPAITPLPTTNTRTYMAENVGAFPRDAQDLRYNSYISNGTFLPLHDSLPGADDAFTIASTTAGVQADGDNDGMPDYWETANGLNPNQQDHNGTGLSLAITGVAGYTNLEVYLNCLADALVNGGTPACAIVLSREDRQPEIKFTLFPNPSTGTATLLLPSPVRGEVTVQSLHGQALLSIPTHGQRQIELDLRGLAKGVYFVQVGGYAQRLILE